MVSARIFALDCSIVNSFLPVLSRCHLMCAGALIQAVVPYAAVKAGASALTYLKVFAEKALRFSRVLLLELHGSALRLYHLV